MNNTITLSQLITRLAKATGVDNNTARLFLRTFFATIEDSLEGGESVTVKNVGTFRLAENDPSGRKKLAFVPDEGMRNEINKPFEMFEAVELAPGVNFDEVDKASATPTPTQVAPAEQISVVEAPAPVASNRPEEEEAVPAPMATGPNVTEEEDGPVYHFPDEDDDDDYEEDEVSTPVRSRRSVRNSELDTEGSSRKRIWIWAIVFILLCGAGALVAAIYSVPIPDLYEDEQEEVLIDDPEHNEPGAEVLVEEVGVEKLEDDAATEAQPVEVKAEKETLATKAESSKEPVYDTVEVSLIRLAKKHYGVAEFWVFIFEANTDKISNPNTIRPGTRVVIPERSTFPGASLEETKSIAKQKQAEYQRKYNR